MLETSQGSVGLKKRGFQNVSNDFLSSFYQALPGGAELAVAPHWRERRRRRRRR
jgi:hypothetical protein